MLWQLFYTFLKIGAFTFGSGYAMISLIEKEIVEKKKWFEHDDFMNQFTLAQMSPGPFSLNTAVFVGYRKKGWWGATVAVAGLVLPSFLIILCIAMFLTDFRDNESVNAAFKGIRPCVIALIAVPFVRFLTEMHSVVKIILAFATLAIIRYTGCSPIYLIGGAAIWGIVLTYFKKPQ